MRPFKLVLTVAAVAAFSAAVASQTPSGHAVFEQALAKERVEGNLPEAIRLYERVVAEFATDRALAAQALVQVGLCYEKLGRDEAVRAYERLVRDFADQEDAVEQARVRLAVLKRPASGTAAAATIPGVRAFPRVDITNDLQALSPDGTKAAFIYYDKGQNLAVYDVASQRTTRLTDIDFDTGLVYYAAWSPDGRRIAYQQCNWQPPPGCELRVATLAGESDVVFRNEAGYSVVPAGWLPDGSALVVALDRADKTLSIGLVPTAGGSFTALRSISGWAGIYPEPVSVSPDRGWIAFTEGSPRDIHVISPDGRTARRITNHPADDHRPLWSPDGRHLAFLSTRNGNTALWTVAIRDGQPAAEPVRVKDGMQDATLRSWTARGLAYSESSRTTDIYTVPVDPASGEPIGSPRQIPYGRTGRNVGPRWSPDGKYLAFVSSSPAEPDRRAVVVLPSGGGEPREFPIPTSVYRSADSPGELRWFGDSRGLGFHGYDPRSERTLFRLTLATGDWKTFPFPVPLPGAGIEWDVDGSRYYYNSNFQNPTRGPGGNRIVERDLQSDRERVVFRGNEKGFDYYLGFKFSPDRRLLAFRSDQGIWILDVETGEARRVHDDVQETPTWSPNGRALLVPRTETPQTDKQVANLRLIPLDGGEVRQIPLGAELTRLLSSSRGTQRPMSSLAWSPDGGRLAFVLRARRDETLVLENPLALAGAASARK